jgi:hypothetical protein
MTKTLKRRFSAGSSSGAGAAMLHGSGNRCKEFLPSVTSAFLEQHTRAFRSHHLVVVHQRLFN